MKNLHQIKETLRKVRIFTEVNDAILDELARDAEQMELDGGQIIFKKGDVQDGMYIIQNGQVKVHDGNYIFATLSDPDFFGEYSLIDSDVRSASVSTTVPTTLIRLKHGVITSVLENNVELNRSILLALTKRLRENNILEEQLVKKNKKIERQQKKLKELNATKDKFFTILAHDLRNPISTINGLADILANNSSNLSQEQIKGYLSSLNHYSANLMEMLNDLLSWSASTAGIISFKPEKNDLSTIISNNLESLFNEATYKKQKIRNKIGSDVCVIADRRMLITIFRNIVGNAVKFCSEGDVITLSAKKSAKKWIISIKDSGPGLSKKDMKRLFKIEEDSKRIGSSANQNLQKNKGSGLGLILCREFILKNKGKIEVESQEGKGTTVLISLPAAN